MALALAKLGDLYHDPALTHESLKLYNHGLRQLQKALWDPDLMFHDHTLTSCIALATYEMSQCPNQSKDAYISHTSGCAKLVQLRGPEAHMDGLAHHVFIHFRTQGVRTRRRYREGPLTYLDSLRPRHQATDVLDRSHLA